MPTKGGRAANASAKFTACEPRYRALGEVKSSGTRPPSTGPASTEVDPLLKDEDAPTPRSDASDAEAPYRPSPGTGNTHVAGALVEPVAAAPGLPLGPDSSPLDRCPGRQSCAQGLLSRKDVLEQPKQDGAHSLSHLSVLTSSNPSTLHLQLTLTDSLVDETEKAASQEREEQGEGPGAPGRKCLATSQGHGMWTPLPLLRDVEPLPT